MNMISETMNKVRMPSDIRWASILIILFTELLSLKSQRLIVDQQIVIQGTILPEYFSQSLVYPGLHIMTTSLDPGVGIGTFAQIRIPVFG